MSVHLEHDYIGLSKVPAMGSSEKVLGYKKNGLNLKATELRLGLPGSESPERDGENISGSQIGLQKALVSGAKRGFSDAINGGYRKWVFTGVGSEKCLAKGAGLFSPRRGDEAQQQLGTSVSTVKEDVPRSPKPVHEKKPQVSPGAKVEVVGWPPIRSFRKNSMASHPLKNDDDAEGMGLGCLYVKVSMDGAPYLRKVDLKIYSSYMEMSSALEKMFSCFTIGQSGTPGVPSEYGLTESGLMDLLHGSEYVLTYEDKDGDWMLVGDVPWEMFTNSCKRMRIMKSSDAIGLAPRAMEKYKNRN